MKTGFVTISLSILLLFSGNEILAQTLKVRPNGNQKILTDDVYDFIDINNILMWMSNDGIMSYNPQTLDHGLEWPKGSGKAAMFMEGLAFGGLFLGQTCVGGSTYRAGLEAGIINKGGTASDPSDPRYRIYKVLNIVKAEYDTMSSDSQAKFRKDFMEWPVADGARFIDSNHNGVYDPDFDAWLADSTSSDKPWFVGDEVMWFVSNDLNLTRTSNLSGSPSMGIEVQTMVWGYKAGGPLPNAIFVKHTLINKGKNDIANFYVGKWMDPDLGDANDDFVGVDTVLNMAYTYNGRMTDGVYGIPPAQGSILAQGPIAKADDGSVARFNFGVRSGYINLPINAFVFYFNGSTVYKDPILGPGGATEMYNNFKGLTWQGNPFFDPVTHLGTKITLAGDPLTGQGWIDGIVAAPGDRRMLMSCGQFTFAKGDTQEVVFSTLLSQGTTNLQSVEELRKDAQTIKSFFGMLPVTSDIPIVSLHVSYPGPNAASIFMTAEVHGAQSVSGIIRKRDGAVLAEFPMYDDGMHGDGGAGDQVYGGSWDTTRLLEGVDCFVRCSYSDNPRQDWLAGHCIPLAGPVHDALYKIESDHLNYDGIPNPGENIRFSVDVENQTPFPIGPWLVNVLESSQGTVQLLTLPSDIPSLQNDHTLYDPMNPATYVAFDVPPSATDGQVLSIPTVISDDNYNIWRDTIHIIVAAFSTPPVDSLMIHIAGPATGSLGWRIVNKNALQNHFYRVTLEGQSDHLAGADSLKSLTILDTNTHEILLHGKYFPDTYAHDIPTTDGWKATQGSAAYLPSFAATYNPPEHQWLVSKVRWSTASDLGWGTTMGPNDNVPVKLVFDSIRRQKAYCYLGNGTPNCVYDGFYDVAMCAYDVSDSANPRQINIAFTEDLGSTTRDETWMPNVDPSNGRELLFILKSNYSPTPLQIYTSSNIMNDAGKLDILYASWLSRKSDSLTFHDGDFYFLQPAVLLSYRDTFILNPLGPTNEIRRIPTAGRITLGQNYPNPFGAGSPSASFATQLPVALNHRDHVTLKIYDMLGRLVNIVYDGILESGYHEIQFYPPPSLPAGLYTAVLTTGAERQTVTMTLLR